MLWLATDRLEVVKEAWPAFSVAVPSVAAPSMNVTVPVGVPEPGAFAVTVAVKVAACPNTAGLADAASAVALAAWFTAWLSAADVLVVKLASPLYTAVMLWLATDRLEVVKEAWPAFSVAVLSVAAPSRNVTVPVGVPEPGTLAVTVAVKV